VVGSIEFPRAKTRERGELPRLSASGDTGGATLTLARCLPNLSLRRVAVGASRRHNPHGPPGWRRRAFPPVGRGVEGRLDLGCGVILGRSASGATGRLAGWLWAPGLHLDSVGGGRFLGVPLDVAAPAAALPPRRPGRGRF
jgi:hypothetical protein